MKVNFQPPLPKQIMNKKNKHIFMYPTTTVVVEMNTSISITRRRVLDNATDDKSVQAMANVCELFVFDYNIIII